MPTNDHTVPRMYLRHFSRQKKKASTNWFITARSVDDLDRVFEANITNVAAVTDFYGQRVERLLAKIEERAAPVFRAILDDPAGALPLHWPLRAEDRSWMAWWIAAQIVRTTRQRRRLVSITAAGTDEQPLEVPHAVKSLAGRDPHLQFITGQLAALGRIVYNRPWGLGFSDACLWTSDVPVVILNGHDDANQLRAAAFWDMILPLDPHRFLILPGLGTRDPDPEKQVDHLTKFDGGLGIWLNVVIYDAADTHLYCHAEHDSLPLLSSHLTGVRLPTPWNGDQRRNSPSYIVEYPPLGRNLTVERRWLTEHPPSRPTTS
ncbi:DUF4238 domain-containing protein [Nonomuraea sp. SBT364]|uniref:DUF4238 domain-containing protein n=1 Tax=Nonomuraea sp. SBT364 TaxID=1580530 RepID=UPI00066A6986|nr:DUF4238 domain-containing protein [Nonomuraea sp. SBT364]